MKRLLGLALMLGLLAALSLSSSAAPTDEQKKAKAKLQEIQAFIGLFNGVGAPQAKKSDFWKETINVGWKFKGDDAWLALDIKDGKYFKGGELRFLPAKDKFELTLLDTADKKLVFEGVYKNEKLLFERVDPETKEKQQLGMEAIDEGVRMIYRYNTIAGGSTLVKKVFEVAATRDGQSFAAAKGKGNVCVVSGGVGTSQVSYKGETFYVCCSGCAEAFKDNPEKYIAEFKAKMKK